MNDYGSDNKSAVQAKFDAQKLAFAPIMFQAARSMRNLGILETLDKNRKIGLTIEEVAENCKISVYGAKVLLEAGISLEIVYVKNDKFYLSKTGWFLIHDDLTTVNMDFTHDVNYLGFFELEESIKNGKPEGLKVFGKWDTVYEALAHLPEQVRKSWFAFDHYYSDNAFPEALPIIFERKPKKILDVGGNTGKFSIKSCEFDKDVKLTILDLPGQLNDAYKNIESHGFSDRIDGHGMNLLDASKPFPTGYDAVWMSQFLDCFSQEDILHLISRGRDALAPDGALYILETFWDKQRYDAAMYSLHATSLYFTCIANGCSQMYHSDDMYKLVDKAGMYVEKAIDNIGVSHTMFICKPKK
jgi:hypothetical protein